MIPSSWEFGRHHPRVCLRFSAMSCAFVLQINVIAATCDVLVNVPQAMCLTCASSHSACVCSDLDLHHFHSRLVSPSNSLVSWRSNGVHSLFFRFLFAGFHLDFLFTLLPSRSDFLRPLEPLFLYKYPRSEPTLSVVSALGSQNLGLSVSHTGGMCITQH